MINYLKTTTVVFVAALSATAAQADTQTYEFSGFSRITTSAGVEVEASVGDSYSVRAEGSKDSLDRLEIKQRGETLRIGRDGALFKMRWKSPIVYVTLPSIEEVEASSGSELSVRGIDAGDFSASVSSGAELYLEGRCDELRASASTGAELEAENLECRDVRVSVSTGAEAEVYASESIDASASTGGDIDVSGSPQERNISKSLGGDVDID